jgi:hypothetical protein
MDHDTISSHLDRIVANSASVIGVDAEVSAYLPEHIACHLTCNLGAVVASAVRVVESQMYIHHTVVSTL